METFVREHCNYRKTFFGVKKEKKNKLKRNSAPIALVSLALLENDRAEDGEEKKKKKTTS